MLSKTSISVARDLEDLEKHLAGFILLPLSNPKYLQYLASYFRLNIEFLTIRIDGCHIFSPIFIMKPSGMMFSRLLRYGDVSPFGFGGHISLLEWTSGRGDPATLSNGLNVLISFCLRELGLKYVKLKVNTYPYRFSDNELSKIRPTRERNIHSSLYFNSDYIMEAKDVPEAWKLIGKKSRNVVRKAERRQLKFRLGNQSDVGTFFSIWRDDISKRHQAEANVYPDFFRGLVNEVPNEVLLTVVEDRLGVIGGTFSLIQNQTLTFLAYTTKKETQQSGSKNYLLWKTIEYALLNRGVRVIEYGESIRESSSASFKRHMGAVEYPIIGIRVFKKPYHLFSRFR